MSSYTVERSMVHEHSVHEFVCEASDLGLPPGHWPLLLQTPLGNGMPFQVGGEGEAGTRYYYQRLGCLKLTVFND